jgi:peroxiredoxin Q/BCP
MAELQPGADAPAFTLPDQSGSPVSLSDFQGRKVLLFFYPKAGTGG